MQQLAKMVEARSLALAVIDAAVDPLVVLDDDARIVAASRSFYDTFKVEPDGAHGRSMYGLCEGAWDAPRLRELLATTIRTRGPTDAFEFAARFPGLGDRILCLNVRVLSSEADAPPTTLVVMKDVTERRQIEADKQRLLEETQELLRQQRLLMKEMQHRVANSLQIIASVLMLKAKGVASQETRDHLQDARQRVISVAEVQAHLHSVEGIDEIDVRAYLSKLCHGLMASMTGPNHPIEITVAATDGTLSSSRAVSLGLIVTELVINAIKYAFPTSSPDARIIVSYETHDQIWRLKVSDNGIGKERVDPQVPGGLGTAIVSALAKQLGGQISTSSTQEGLTVSLAGVNGDANVPLAA